MLASSAETFSVSFWSAAMRAGSSLKPDVSTLATAAAVGFVPAAPLAWLAARSKRVPVVWIADGLGFAIYFWISGSMSGWKAAWTD